MRVKYQQSIVVNSSIVRVIMITWQSPVQVHVLGGDLCFCCLRLRLSHRLVLDHIQYDNVKGLGMKLDYFPSSTLAHVVAWSPIRSKAQNANTWYIALPISHILHCGYYTLLPLSFTNSAINHKNCVSDPWLYEYLVSDPKCSQKIVRIRSLLI